MMVASPISAKLISTTAMYFSEDQIESVYVYILSLETYYLRKNGHGMVAQAQRQLRQ